MGAALENAGIDDDFEHVREGRTAKFRHFLARTERIYLEILRAAALVVATAILAWIVWLLITSAYGISRDADAVEVAPVELTAEEVVDVDLGESDAAEAENEEQSKEPTSFDRFRDQYFSLYQRSFEKFLKDNDEKISKDQFTERFLSGFQPDDAEDLESAMESYVLEADYAGLLATMQAAAKLPVTEERLKKYKDTPKTRVEDQVRRTRQEQYCSYWSDYFGECFAYDTRSVPYTETVARMETPAGILEPPMLFGAYQDNYLAKLNAKRDESSSNAAEERAERLAANAEGWLGLSNAVWFAGAFIAIMFFFLLIAIERHQRVIAYQVED